MKSMCRRCDAGAFVLSDLLASIAVLALIVGLTLPRLAKATVSSSVTVCLENQRRFGVAWQQFAADHNDRVVNNFSIAETYGTVSSGTFNTWANNVLDWTTNERNTNLVYLRGSKLFSYLSDDVSVFKCPAENYKSAAQSQRGWTGRVRSYSMNGYVGATGQSDPSTTSGLSPYSSNLRQFLKINSIPDPSKIFVFLEEHPDSVNDGEFINFPSSMQWADLPASYHSGSCTFGFADAHAELRSWVNAGTVKAVTTTTYSTPTVTPSQSADFNWVMVRTSVNSKALVSLRSGSDLRLAWSSSGGNLEFNADLTTNTWVRITNNIVSDFGEKSYLASPTNEAAYFRVR